MPGYKADDLPEEVRITVRFNRQQQVHILEHQDRIARNSPGVSVSAADSIRNLISLGAQRAHEQEGE